MNATMSNTAATVRTELRKNVRRAQDRLADLQTTAMRRARRGMRTTDYLAHEHPWEFAAGAAALGAAVGAVVAVLIMSHSR